MKGECLLCGACCSAFGVVEVFPEDEMPDSFTTATEMGYRRMRTNGFTCICLTEDKACDIYENRPQACRRFEPGGELCQMAREHVLNSSNHKG
jgi:Fe-S-cluster containining protein